MRSVVSVVVIMMAVKCLKRDPKRCRLKWTSGCYIVDVCSWTRIDVVDVENSGTLL